MEKSGKTIRILAIVAMVLLILVVFINYSSSSEQMNEAKAEIEEKLDDHKDRSHGSYYYGGYSSSSCSTCESYEESLKEYERYGSQLFLTAAQSALGHTVSCIILFALGSILSTLGERQDYTCQVPAQPASSSLCPSCGHRLQPGVSFCPACGNNIHQ